MTNLSERKSQPRWMASLLASTWKCHLLGSSVSGVLLLAIGWIWVNADRFAEDARYSQQQIKSSIQLVSTAGELRNNHAEDLQNAKEIEARIEAIAAWLPTTKPGQPFLKLAKEAVAANSLKLLKLEEENKHVGERVGTQSFECVVEGSYENVCKLLHQLATGKTPVWCNAIRIDRSPNEIPGDIECRTMISIRVPYAAPGTIAGKLLQVEAPKNAS